jgi:prepilin-type N-terminal cleavage/methylation domain-containing protein
MKKQHVSVEGKVAYKGFTLIELLMTLVLFASLMLIVNRVINDIAAHKKYNQVADQINFYSKMSVKYIMDNYVGIARELQDNEVDIVSGSRMQSAGYIPAYSFVTNFYRQMPCLWITKKNGLELEPRAYLLFVNSYRSQNSTHLDAANIANNIGGIAGFLSPNVIGMGMTVNGKMFNNYLITTNNIDLIERGCGGTLMPNSIVVNLNADKEFFMQLKDLANSGGDANNKLKRSSVANSGNLTANTMQTNLYLDNIVREESRTKNVFCDPKKIAVSDADTLCENKGRSQGWHYIGSPKWVDAIQHGNQCEYKAEALFNHRSYTCDKSKFPYSAADVCREEYWPGGERMKYKYYEYPVAYWSGGYQDGDRCRGNVPYGYFDVKTCDGAVERSHFWDEFYGIVRDLGCKNYTTPHDDIQILYYENTCHLWYGGMCYGGKSQDIIVRVVAPVNNYNPNNIQRLLCGFDGASYTFDASPVDGPSSTRACGSRMYPAFESETVNPAQHAYRRIDFGENGLTVYDDKSNKDNKAPQIHQRIELGPEAKFGKFVNSSQLNIAGAGIKAGIVAPNSRPIKVGDPCTAGELGNIAQEMVPDTFGVSGGQLQCGYNIIYCANASAKINPDDAYYCYLPTKNATINYTFRSPKRSYTCPNNTVVDNNQSSASVLKSNALCVAPDLLGGKCSWVLNRGPYGIIPSAGCTKVDIKSLAAQQVNLSVCHTYMAQCDYANSCNRSIIKSMPVAALVGTRCSAASNDFVIDNYQP